MDKFVSLDARERATYEAGPSPMDGAPASIPFTEGMRDFPAPREALSLDGEWEMMEGGNADRVYEAWEGASKARVPGSVSAALIESGQIEEPTFGKNDVQTREKSQSAWWFGRSFAHPGGEGRFRLEFGGVCDRCVVWLNGRLLGGHQGMFGGPEFDVTDLLRAENRLLVMLYPAPRRTERKPGELNPFFDGMNVGWIDTTVFNCVYGWHYANIPALGIWRSVRLVRVPRVEMEAPFVCARDAEGTVDLCVALNGEEGGYSGELKGEIALEGADETLFFAHPVESSRMRSEVRVRLVIPNARLWWPNGLGEQNLYRLRLAFVSRGEALDVKEARFGIRTVEMAPCMGEAREDAYNWQFVVNGQSVFVKGANWCTLDFAMRFSRARYERFLSLARDQHIQLLRAWGGGMPETDEFYELCDQYGILVLQEFPTAWDSQKVQPPEVLREGVERTVLRLRNHPSLAMWGGGNESERPTDAVIDMMGRIVYELDGTRVFHRNDPWGGSSHNYSVYWGRADLDFNLSYAAPFIGEFGFASAPNLESARKYLPPEDFESWPPARDGSVAYHTPVFDQKADMEILNHYAPLFLPNESLANWITSLQMCQATSLRHTLELARARRPEATGICYYKLTDVFPAVSWSTIDWYGAPKMAYYFVQDSYAPLHACALFSALNPMGEPQALRVHLLDDANELEGKSWRVGARAYGADLKRRKAQEYAGHGAVGAAGLLGAFEIDGDIAREAPLLVVVDLLVEGEPRGRTFYWLNYKERSGCLFDRPRTRLALSREPGLAIIQNVGAKPAVGVHFSCEEISDRFAPADSFFWLEPGERVEISVNRDDYRGIEAWNADLADGAVSEIFPRRGTKPIF